jgi:uncharacterized membrane protein YkvA (DUF1232 family)
MKAEEKPEKYSRYFDKDSLFNKIVNFSGKAGTNILFYALILYFLVTNTDIPMRTRLIFLAALGYFILPTDLISDFLPGLGFTDDLSFMIYAMTQGTDHITPELKSKARSKLANLVGNKNKKDIVTEEDSN